MNDLKSLSPAPIATAVQSFFSEASDLYVDFLSDGRKTLAESLLSGIVLAVASLDRVSQQAPGPERTRELRHAASVFHKLSLLIFVSALNNDTEDDEADLRSLHAYDTAADLSGKLISAARHG